LLLPSSAYRKNNSNKKKKRKRKRKRKRRRGKGKEEGREGRTVIICEF